jgi:hypothetical protein
MSVTWRRFETLMTSWHDRKAPFRSDDGNERRRETGFATLAAAFRSAPQAERKLPDLEDWMPRTEAVVAR